MRRAIVFLTVFFASLMLRAQSADSITISLITCSPGTEVYSLYGHTAIRCQNHTSGDDWVFNYGVFSFSQPHFIWRFVRGKCDYMVQAVPWRYFIPEYEERGSSVTAQYLNLTSGEALRVFSYLVWNCRKENCEYRYNFLCNNCTTMVRDVIERSVEGEVCYANTLPHYTYRQILHLYTHDYPWAQEGNDILLGAAVDTTLSCRAAMFAPEVMMQYADEAVIRHPVLGDRPLVRSKEILLQKKELPVKPKFPLPPISVMIILVSSCVLVMLLELCFHRMFWLWDILLMLPQGVAGLLLLFMFFFSEHPAVDTNWQIWVLNPLALVGLPLVVRAAWNRRRTLWHAFNFVLLTLFMVFSPWIPQVFGDIVVPLALALLTRPISYYLYYRKEKHR